MLNRQKDNELAINHMMHSFPIISLFIDWNFNRILAELRHWAVGMTAASLYALFLVAYTFITGEPIYSVVSLKSAKSWLFLLAVFVLDLILVLAFDAYGACKFKAWGV